MALHQVRCARNDPRLARHVAFLWLASADWKRAISQLGHTWNEGRRFAEAVKHRRTCPARGRLLRSGRRRSRGFGMSAPRIIERRPRARGAGAQRLEGTGARTRSSVAKRWTVTDVRVTSATGL